MSSHETRRTMSLHSTYSCRPRARVRLRLSLIYCAVLLAALTLPAGTTAHAQRAAEAPARELLNSERIEQTFGSYGVQVLTGDAHVRVSNLYSGDAESRTCRTFAVVRYPDRVDPAFTAEHAEILRGGSIGAVFAAHGWRVLKTHLAMQEVTASPRVAALMRVDEGRPLALHAYVLEIAKDGTTFPYASLVEIHHPDYLSVADLQRIYGPPSAAGREALLHELLATTRTELAR